VLQHIKIIIDVLIRINTCRVDRGLPGERFKIDLMHFRAENKVYSFDGTEHLSLVFFRTHIRNWYIYPFIERRKCIL